MVYKAVFQGFLREIRSSSRREFFSSQSLVQSSVGMIFRVHPPPTSYQSLMENISSVQLLFAQRSGYAGDLNAYNIVFPGGQAQLGENDYHACARQIQQEIALQVNTQCIYLGQIPRNFYYMKKRKILSLYMNCHVWAMKKGQENWQPNLNKAELIDYKWVSFQHLLNLSNYTFSTQLMRGLVERAIPKVLSRYTQNIIANIQSMKFPVLDISMGRKLWGLTLWLCSFMIQMGLHQIKKHPHLYLKDHQSVQQAKNVVQIIKKIEIKFKRSYFLGYPFSWAIKYWHNNYRVKPFTYQRQTNSMKYILTLSIIGIILVLIWYYYFLQIRITV